MSATSPTRDIIGCVGTLALLVGLAACSTGGPEAGGIDTAPSSAGPAATPTPTPAPTPAPTAWDPEASATWAATVFPLTGTGQYVTYKSGQLGEGDGGGSSVTSHDTAPGSYELQLACQGDEASTVTIDLTAAGGPSARLSAPCDERIQTTPVTLVEPGVTVTVTRDGEPPVLWAAVLATTPLG